MAKGLHQVFLHCAMLQTQREEIKTYLTLPIYILGFALKASWTQKS